MGNSIRKHGIFLIAIAIIFVVLGGFIWMQEAILREGETTILKTRPVDPRDLLRGEYVILNYEIATDRKVRDVLSGMNGDSLIYIKLEEDEKGIAFVSEVKIQEPKMLPNELWIVGDVTGNQVHFPTIEQYFVPEGTGQGIESIRSGIHVEVVMKDGHVRVKKLLDAQLRPIDPESFLKEK